MREFASVESNRRVLETVLRELRRGTDIQTIIDAAEAFLKLKEHIRTRLGELTIAARGGDKEAARTLISVLAEENDGS